MKIKIILLVWYLEIELLFNWKHAIFLEATIFIRVIVRLEITKKVSYEQ